MNYFMKYPDVIYLSEHIRISYHNGEKRVHLIHSCIEFMAHPNTHL